MALDVNSTERSYLFGRLLAIAEKVESDTYKQGEERETNAMRYQSAFAQHPMSTFRMLEERLSPYYKKLCQMRPASYRYYKGLIGEVMDKLPQDSGTLNRKLEDSYLIGYYCQRSAFYQKKAAESGESEEQKGEEV